MVQPPSALTVVMPNQGIMHLAPHKDVQWTESRVFVHMDVKLVKYVKMT